MNYAAIDFLENRFREMVWERLCKQGKVKRFKKKPRTQCKRLSIYWRENREYFRAACKQALIEFSKDLLERKRLPRRIETYTHFDGAFYGGSTTISVYY